MDQSTGAGQYFLTHLRTGRAIRATSQNKQSAVLQGINLNWTSALTMAIGAALAAVSGSLMGSVINIGPFMGLEAIWKAFIVVIVGGMGSIPGAVAAAVMFGFIDSLSSTFGLGQFIVMIDTLIMLAVLAFFPQGLMGSDAPPLETPNQSGARVISSNFRPGKLFYASGGAFFLGILIVLPFVLPRYLQDALVLFVVNAILVMSYRLITTMGGWSFAHIAMMAIGSYTMAMLTTAYAGISFWLTIPLGGIFAFLVAFAISYPVLRTKQFYFFLSTFAAGEAIRQCFIQFEDVLGGIEGIPFIDPPDPIFGLSFYDTTNYYFRSLYTVVTIARGHASGSLTTLTCRSAARANSSGVASTRISSFSSLRLGW